MSEKPNQVVSQVKYAPTGVDEQAGILMMNEKQEMVTIALTLHSKQPKRGMISCDKGYIEPWNIQEAKKRSSPIQKQASRKSLKKDEQKRPLYYVKCWIWKQRSRAIKR